MKPRGVHRLRFLDVAPLAEYLAFRQLRFAALAGTAPDAVRDLRRRVDVIDFEIIRRSALLASAA